MKCENYETDADGNVTVVHCTYDPETKSGSGFTVWRGIFRIDTEVAVPYELEAVMPFRVREAVFYITALVQQGGRLFEPESEFP